MNKSYFIELYDYDAWANRRVWECVMQLSAEQFNQELDHSLGSIWNQVLHTLAVESWWFKFLSTGELEFVDEETMTTRPAIRAAWDGVAAMIRDYLARLTPEELERSVRPSFWEDDNKPIKVWQALLQVANHSTDHRAQTMAGLQRLGAPTVGQDVLDYLFEKQKQA
jgi:uncharacterized damage-inducible protein DinB